MNWGSAVWPEPEPLVVFLGSPTTETGPLASPRFSFVQTLEALTVGDGVAEVFFGGSDTEGWVLVAGGVGLGVGSGGAACPCVETPESRAKTSVKNPA